MEEIYINIARKILLLNTRQKLVYQFRLWCDVVNKFIKYFNSVGTQKMLILLQKQSHRQNNQVKLPARARNVSKVYSSAQS